jgi:hypothetical protein
MPVYVFSFSSTTDVQNAQDRLRSGSTVCCDCCYSWRCSYSYQCHHCCHCQQMLLLRLLLLLQPLHYSDYAALFRVLCHNKQKKQYRCRRLTCVPRVSWQLIPPLMSTFSSSSAINRGLSPPPLPLLLLLLMSPLIPPLLLLLLLLLLL